jgi:hypothetical protein
MILVEKFRIQAGTVISSLIVSLFLSAGCPGQDKKPSVVSKRTPPNVEPGAGLPSKSKSYSKPPSVLGDFLLMPVEGSPILFMLTLYERSSRSSVTGMYNIGQLQAFESIMSESRKFSDTIEGIGRTKPVITRFFSDNEPSFFVDVSRMGKATQFFVTMQTRSGNVTMDCGTLRNGEAVEEFLFDKMLARFQEVVRSKLK